jgi:hypothetical protein
VLPPANAAPVLTYANDDAATLLHDAMASKETVAQHVARIMAQSYGGAGSAVLLDEDAPADDADAADAMSAAAQQRRLGAFFEALLKAGQQSFSHLLHAHRALSADCEATRHSVGGAAARRQVVDVAIGLWRQSPQLQVLVLDRLQSYGIIDVVAVVDWAFDPANVSHVKHGYVRDIVRGAVRWAVQSARLAVAGNSSGGFDGRRGGQARTS